METQEKPRGTSACRRHRSTPSSMGGSVGLTTLPPLPTLLPPSKLPLALLPAGAPPAAYLAVPPLELLSLPA
jgi:hypothetical protein